MLDINSYPKIFVGKYTIYVASTAEQKKQGLQFLARLPDKHLMLFQNTSSGVFFHTINCAFPMDILPLNSQNKVLDMWSVGTNMKLIGPTPQKTTSVIEGPFGWAKQNQLQIGSDLREALLS